jgi:pyrroline-5-carboxylate reductase
MMQYKTGFIGCGNMGGALARATAKAIGGSQVAVCDYDTAKTELLKAELSAIPMDAKELIQRSDYVFLGIKPQMMERAVSPLLETINDSDCVIVTMAAGLCIEYFESVLGINRPIIRIMPNTPVKVGKGVVAFCSIPSLCKEDEDRFVSLMKPVGLCDKLPESLIDAECAVAGCGPAFVYMFIEALADGAVKCGLPRDKALTYAAETVKGAADMVLITGEHPEALKDAVCSPGGATIEGVAALEAGGFRATLISAVTKAFDKIKKLG